MAVTPSAAGLLPTKSHCGGKSHALQIVIVSAFGERHNSQYSQCICNLLQRPNCVAKLTEKFGVEAMVVKKIDKRKISHSMVAFVDLLGFSERVKGLETLDDLADVQAKVRNVQAWFGRNPKDKFEREEANVLSKSVLAFSDCVVIAVSSHSELAKMQGGFDIFMGELSSFAYAQATCVVNGIFIRGGVVT
jgi:hypothetical protein